MTDFFADPRVAPNEPMGRHCTYRVGGTVRAFVTVRSRSDLSELAPRWQELGIPVMAVGNGSNLLVADGAHEVVVVQLREGFDELAWRETPDGIEAHLGAGLDLPVAARRLAAQGVGGFEWAVGVPGTVGGALAMNAGGHGSDMAATVTTATVWRNGVERLWSISDLALGYRSSALIMGDVVTDVTMTLQRTSSDEAKELLSEIVRWRREHQPGGANAGSVFRNPPGDRAGRLIEAAGGRGLRVGSATTSDKHANFILADEGGRANDIWALMVELRRRVREETGITLEAETRLVGFGAMA
jgi:UDP-N-acetylmuramate dehydrogenase